MPSLKSVSLERDPGWTFKQAVNYKNSIHLRFFGACSSPAPWAGNTFNFWQLAPPCLGAQLSAMDSGVTDSKLVSE